MTEPVNYCARIAEAGPDLVPDRAILREVTAIERAYGAGDLAAIRAAARRLRRRRDAVPLLGRVCCDILVTAARNDGAALAATVARLSRCVRAS